MAEEKKTEDKKEKKKGKGDAEAAATPAVDGLAPSAVDKRKAKESRWTIALCKKAAHRFGTRDEWAQGAPSSYKAAVARGWDQECCKGMKPTTTKTTGTKTPTRRSA